MFSETHIDDLIDGLHGAKLFSKVDPGLGQYNIPILIHGQENTTYI
jgi:hypothetical protein